MRDIYYEHIRTDANQFGRSLDILSSCAYRRCHPEEALGVSGRKRMPLVIQEISCCYQTQ
jgi:hypothetical protein